MCNFTKFLFEKKIKNRNTCSFPIDKRTKLQYENKLSGKYCYNILWYYVIWYETSNIIFLKTDWMAIEAIVRQKDKETTAANIAKLAGKVLSFLKNK